ncbi:MAG: hypothetical protein ACKVT2_15550 [Saprospiraceae bacterium]
MKHSSFSLTWALWGIFFFFHAPSSSCQEALRDSVYSKVLHKVYFSLNGGAGQISPVVSDRVLVPDVVWKERMAYDPYHSKEKKQTDEPFQHAAFWGKIEASAHIFRQNKLSIGIIAEHRGESFGIYSLEHLVALPVIKIEINDSLKIGKRKIAVKGQTGFLEKVFLDQGLMFYNIDAQGSLLRFEGKKYALEYDILGDLFAGIGLGINDVIQFRVKRFFGGQSSRRHTLSLTLSKFTRVDNFASFENPILPSLSYGYKKGRMDIGGQITLRTGNPLQPIPGHLKIEPKERLGLKIGVAYSTKAKNFSFKGALDCRYYGRFFNADNYSPNRTYRDYSQPAHGNFKGQHLYPLKNYFYDFSQWAVFTEYGIRELGAATLVAKADIRVWKWLWYSNYLDFNVLAVERAIPFLYPFYCTGFSIKLNDDACINLFATNKTMNLDVHYNTFYLTEKPYGGLVFKYRIKE